jgi:hypothetical protein
MGLEFGHAILPGYYGLTAGLSIANGEPVAGSRGSCRGGGACGVGSERGSGRGYPPSPSAGWLLIAGELQGVNKSDNSAATGSAFRIPG